VVAVSLALFLLTLSYVFTISKRCTPVSALHQFFNALPIIWAQVAAKRFLQNSR
jgi:hypothetical protein